MSIQDLSDHLESALAQPVRLRRARPKKLPLYLREAYAFHEAELLARPVLFAVANDEAAQSPPRQLVADHGALEERAPHYAVALVLRHITSDRRRRLVEARVPFVVPARQLYLPTLMLDLREYFPRSCAASDAPLEWSAQTVLLRHLLWRDVEAAAFSDVAAACEYSPMTLSHVSRELTATGIAEPVTHGRSKRLHFLHTGRDAWEHALPRLRSPVQKTVYVSHRPAELHGPTAALTALSRSTAIAADPVPTIALGRREARRVLDESQLRTCRFADEAALIVEIWMTPPHVLARDDIVDPLSLYLSLRSTHDERVVHELSVLLESVSW